MSSDVTGQWSISQTHPNGTKQTGTWTLKQQGWKITGNAVWKSAPAASIIGVMVGTTVSFSAIYPGDYVGHYAANFNPSKPNNMTQGVGHSNHAESATWEATKRGS